MAYRKYDPFIKKLIIETGDKTLFPELGIPRTTIEYWLKESKEKTTTEKNDYYEKALRKIQEDNFILKAKDEILKECLSKLLVEAKFHNPKSKKNREFLLEVIEKFKGIIPTKHILDLLNISQSSYHRWQVEKSGCKYNEYIHCEVTSPMQLTVSEQKQLIKMAKSKDFRKFSTVSLMHYCKRKKILNCSLETWYKYIKLYGVKRKTMIGKSKKYTTGLRAKKVNEIWHIDITEIKMEDQKAYLQLVVDNYSRMIVAWKVSLNKTMNITYKTLLKSFNFVPEFNGKIICDGGSENIGFKPKSLLLGKGIKQLIAKRDIRFSNSMVEAVFRQLKQKFYIKPAKSLKSLYQRMYKFVIQYNYIIPHSALFGGTPKEVFDGEFNKDEYTQKNNEELEVLRASRREQFKKCFSCEKKYLRSITV